MRKLRRLLSATAFVGLACGFWSPADRRSDVHAANPGFESAAAVRTTAMLAQAQQRGANAVATAPSSTLFRQYCVGCHNERMKGSYGNLSLEGIDAGDVAGHVETLEKVVRKLRKGQMPPEGRPRPDAATLDAFIASLESSLDRLAEQEPRPGRVVSRRLNRAEYVNAVYDLLGVEVNGAELLPSDMAGFGFDNNADVLSITPALMARYITAATKISRVALATANNRPATIQYKVEIGTRQDARMGEAMGFATFGGVVARHTFPLDGEYAFQMRLTRDQDGLINGIMAEHQIELRVDRELVKRFAIGGEYKEPDGGQLIAVPEDDVFGMKVHKYLHQRRRCLDGARSAQGRHTNRDRGVRRIRADSRPARPRWSNRRRRHARHVVDLGTVQGDENGGHASSSEDLQLHTGHRPRRGTLRPTDPHHARAPGLPRIGRQGRCRPAARDLQEGTGRAGFRYRHRARARSAAVFAQVRPAD